MATPTQLGRVFGHIDGIPPGTPFRSRKDLHDVGVHALIQGGIHGDSSPDGGAFSICLSGGYEDNQDRGERITYVGSGGQGDDGVQNEHQSFDDPPNKSLLVSCLTKRPVRVIRGKNGNGFYAPRSGFRYDGLYVVDNASAEIRRGKKGFDMCFFELRRLREEGDGEIPNRRRLTTKTLNKMLRGAKTK